MNSMELDAYRAQLVRDILDTDDYDVLQSIKNILTINNKCSAPPCRMSDEDVRNYLAQSEQRFAKGDYVSEEEMEVFYETLR